MASIAVCCDWRAGEDPACGRRSRPLGQDDVRHRGVRRRPARQVPPPRRRTGGRCHLRQRRIGRIGAGLGNVERRRAPQALAARAAPRARTISYARDCSATAAMDLSDGLSLDLHRLSKASGLSAEIEAPPIFRGATLTQALHGGEDYELLFTVPARASVPEQLRRTSADANWYDAKRPRGRGSNERRRPRTARLRPFSKTMNPPNPEPVLDLIEAFRRSKTMFAAVSTGHLRPPAVKRLQLRRRSRRTSTRTPAPRNGCSMPAPPSACCGRRTASTPTNRWRRPTSAPRARIPSTATSAIRTKPSIRCGAISPTL